MMQTSNPPVRFLVVFFRTRRLRCRPVQKAKAIGFEAVELIGEEPFDQVRDAGLVIASHGGHQSISAA